METCSIFLGPLHTPVLAEYPNGRLVNAGKCLYPPWKFARCGTDSSTLSYIQTVPILSTSYFTQSSIHIYVQETLELLRLAPMLAICRLNGIAKQSSAGTFLHRLPIVLSRLHLLSVVDTNQNLSLLFHELALPALRHIWIARDVD